MYLRSIMNICSTCSTCSRTYVREHMFEQCSSRTYVRAKSFLAELRKLGHRSHFEHLSDETYETVERTKLQTDLALEFPAMECFNLCNCWMPEKSIKMSPQWGRMSHSMFEACSRHVRAVFVNGFWQCCNFMVWGCCHWAEEDCAWDWVLPLWRGAASL